jgi:hypothetical protein
VGIVERRASVECQRYHISESSGSVLVRAGARLREPRRLVGEPLLNIYGLVPIGGLGLCPAIGVKWVPPELILHRTPFIPADRCFLMP